MVKTTSVCIIFCKGKSSWDWNKNWLLVTPEIYTYQMIWAGSLWGVFCQDSLFLQCLSSECQALTWLNFPKKYHQIFFSFFSFFHITKLVVLVATLWLLISDWIDRLGAVLSDSYLESLNRMSHLSHVDDIIILNIVLREHQNITSQSVEALFSDPINYHDYVWECALKCQPFRIPSQAW